MSRITRRLAGLAVTAVAAGALVGMSAPASAAFLTTGTDPAGDSTDADPGRDIVAVALSYDRREGALRGGVRFAGEPDFDLPANLTLLAGRRTATGCDGYPAIGFGTQTDMRRASWIRLDAPGAPPGAQGIADKTYDEALEEYEAFEKALAGKRPNCVVAQLNEPGNPGVVYDIAGPYALRALPELDARLGKLPKAMTPGTTKTIRVTLRNPGDAPTGRIRLGVAGARGLKVKMPRAVPTLRPGAKRVIELRVTLARGAKTFTNLRVTAKAKDGLRAQAKGELYLRTPSRPSGGSGSGGGSGGSSGPNLCIKYTWLPPYSMLVPC